MAKRGSATPDKVNDCIIRSKDVVQLFDQKKITDTKEHQSEGIVCRDFREFLLYLGIDSTGAPTTLQVKLKYLDPWTGKWHTYKQGLFASLFYEDGDTASGVHECFSGEVMGSEIVISLTGVGTTDSAYFTVDTAIEFRN